MFDEPHIEGGALVHRTAREPRGFGVKISSPFDEELETAATVALVKDAFNVPLFNTILSDNRHGMCAFAAKKKDRVDKVVGV